MKKVLLVMLAVVLLLMAGCGKTAEAPADNTEVVNTPEPTPEPTNTPEPTPEPGPDMAEISGLYKLAQMSTEEDGDLAEDIALMESVGLTISLELNRDGTGTITMYDEDPEAFTWDENGISIDGEPREYTYENDAFTIAGDGVVMVFERTTLSDLRALEELARSLFEEEPAEPAGAVSIEGDYAATACRLDGVETSVEDERMHLNGDGTGTFTLMGYDFDIAWQLDGDSFRFQDITDDEFVGTYHDGVIEGEYFGGYYYVFERTDTAEAAPAEDAAEVEEAQPVEEPAADTTAELRPAVPGVYKVVELYSNEEGDLTDSLPLLESWGMVFTLELYDDGTGVVDEIDEYAYLTWDDEYFYEEDEEEPCPYTFDGSRLRLVEPAGYTVFELTE